MHGPLAGCVFFCCICLLVGAGCASSTPLRVMSFNVRYGSAPDGADSWTNRRELLFSTIEKFNPDLFGTQEALAFQVDEIQSRLHGYSVEGVGRDDGDRKGEFSAVFFRTDRFDELDHGTFWLSATPDVAGSKGWDAMFPRIVTWVKLRRRNDNRELIFLNTHFDHAGAAARLESAKLVLKWLEDVTHSNRIPAIFSGDFNSTEDDPPIQLLTATGLRDSYRQVHPNRSPDEATYHAFKGTTNGSRIDFIFYTRDFVARSAQIDRMARDGHFPSDHFAVSATIDCVKR